MYLLILKNFCRNVARVKDEQAGLVGLKYECLPNFCYWCGQVTHGERDCELWLCGKGTMKKADQKFGEWMRADSYKSFRKTVSIVPSNARSQAPWWRKPDSCPKERSSMANPVRHSDNRVVGKSSKYS